MRTCDKLDIIETIEEKPDISVYSKQSIKVLFPCGCYFIQHSYAGKSGVENSKYKDGILSDRFFFVELCKKHEYGKI